MGDSHLRALVSASAGSWKAESNLTLIGANLFRLSGDDFWIEPRLQQKEQKFYLTGRFRHGDWIYVLGQHGSVIGPLHFVLYF